MHGFWPRTRWMEYTVCAVIAALIFVILFPVFAKPPHRKNSTLIGGDLKPMPNREIYVLSQDNRRYGPIRTDRDGRFDTPKGVVRPRVEGYLKGYGGHGAPLEFSPPAVYLVDLIQEDGSPYKEPLDIEFITPDPTSAHLRVENGHAELANMPAAIRNHQIHMRFGQADYRSDRITRTWDGNELKLRIVVSPPKLKEF